jgi:hypothetical protein
MGEMYDHFIISCVYLRSLNTTHVAPHESPHVMASCRPYVVPMFAINSKIKFPFTAEKKLFPRHHGQPTLTSAFEEEEDQKRFPHYAARR